MASRLLLCGDHQPLKNLESLAAKLNRVQRWFDFLNAYAYTLVYRPRQSNGNADLLSRLPLPASKDETDPGLRLTNPSDVDVYWIGASGVRPSRLREGPGSSLGGLRAPEPRVRILEGEREVRIGPLQSDDEAQEAWRGIQQDRAKAMEGLASCG